MEFEVEQAKRYAAFQRQRLGLPPLSPENGSGNADGRQSGSGHDDDDDDSDDDDDDDDDGDDDDDDDDNSDESSPGDRHKRAASGTYEPVLVSAGSGCHDSAVLDFFHRIRTCESDRIGNASGCHRCCTGCYSIHGCSCYHCN